MYEYVEKPKENKSRSVANSVGQSRCGGVHDIANSNVPVKQEIQLQKIDFSTTKQLKKYSIEKNIKMDIGEKVWEGKKGEGERDDQMAKTRARGESIKYLREMYPTSDGSKDDSKRGEKFQLAKESLDERYKLTDEENLKDEAISTRPAIYRNAPEGRRSGNQAKGINNLTGVEYIGAHLIKREWGGSDNMWNVVAWLKTAEKKWAENFENPVDMKGVFGQDPGRVSIKVTKEDEYIPDNAHERLIEGATINKTGFESIASSRASINRAIESVPYDAEGKNYQSTTTLSNAETGYAGALSKADDKFRSDVNDAKSISAERSDYNGKRPIPDDIGGADEIERAKALKERRRDWLKEKGTYDTGVGKGQFEFTNTLFEEE